MSIYRSMLFILGLLLCFGGATSCSSDPPQGAETSGTMSMPLQTTAPSGNIYQLRSATFSVFAAGATTPTTTLTTSAFNDPSAVLTTPLAVGSYTIQLQTPGWQVIRIDGAGNETAVAATLTSANPASFSIVSNQTTNVGFAFDVPGDGSIGFGGNLGVSISVNEGGSGGGGAGSFVLTASIIGPLGTPSPGTVTGPGISCSGSATADCSESFPSGTSVQLTAAPSGALVFSGWSGAGCTDPAGGTLTTPTITLTMSQAINCIATFSQQQQFTLNVLLATPLGLSPGTVSGPGITCDTSAAPDCSESYPSGTSVQLTAMGNAATGIAFANWSGPGCTDPTGNPLTTPTITLTMNQNVTCTARFQAAATFPPAGLAIEAWYSAEPAFITQSATGQISQWSDRSAFGRHLTQTTVAQQPTFAASGWAAGAGQGAVVFNGGQHMAAGAALGSRFNGTAVPFSVLAVIRMASDTDAAIATFEQSGTANAFMRMRVSDGGPFLRFQATNNAAATFQNDENALLSVATGNVVSWAYTGTSSLLNTDGNPQDSVALSLGAVTTDVFRVGAALTGNPIPLNGRIAELIVVSGAITATQYADFRNYARSRWAGLP